MKFSIIIINYNYSEYLSECILSCLSQTYNNKEVIVVDDGSTDNSIEIINSFGSSVIKYSQNNSGMMEAANNGFSIASGEIVMFIDADDYLLPGALDSIKRIWKPELSKVHFRLIKKNYKGEVIGYVPPLGRALDQGNVWEKIINYGHYETTPTTGNAFSRDVLSKFFPIKDSVITDGKSYFLRMPTDAYLRRRVLYYGPIAAIEKPLGVYRIHGTNKGALTNPYSNIYKRRRVLYQIKSDIDFISNKLKQNEIEWAQSVIFKKKSYLLLRLLSYRLDSKNHLWPEDSKMRIISISFKNIDVKKMNNILKSFYSFIQTVIYAYIPIFILKIIVNKYNFKKV